MPDCFGDYGDRGALVDALFAVDPRLKTDREHAGGVVSGGDARGDYFPSSSLRASATFAASIDSEIRTPAKASSNALRSAVSAAG